MAIKMVREPSDTPNINNIDDIIPMRYAYGGQNGFVIGKGTEISNTVNGSNFIINSGRLVLQGVECDIDATGVTIAVDNIATKRYYTIYLKVNLATNTATIESSYDTADYPAIDDGDDLTENSSGIANMVLYKFTATSGIISEVNKVVESIKYTPKFTFDNNGVLKVGDTIIPQKISLLSQEINVGVGAYTITLNNVKDGDIIKIECILDGKDELFKETRLKDLTSIYLGSFDIKYYDSSPRQTRYNFAYRRIYMKKINDSSYELDVLEDSGHFDNIYDNDNKVISICAFAKTTLLIKNIYKIIE